jgi:16S rRNA (cytosine967-C5)-methyltransferase
MSGARSLACQALLALEKGRAQRLQDSLRARALGAADRRLARELAFGVERQRALLDAVLEALAERGLPRDPLLRVALRLGAYQLLFLSRVPPHAAVHETVALVPRGRAFVNALLRALAAGVRIGAADPARPRREIELPDGRALVLDVDALPDPRARSAWLAVRYSVPEFLARRWLERHGDEQAERIAAAASRTPAVWLRARRAIGAAALQEELAAAGVHTERGAHPLLLRWSGGGSPFSTAAFVAGRFVAQDPTALAAVEALDAQPGETVLDLCAAPGTKATALAELVAPAGRVFAWDAIAARRARIRENAHRLRLADVLCVVDDLAGVPAVDAVLVDAPCSNTGVLARRVEVRRRVTGAAIEALAAAQRELLREALARVRPGGRVLYSTCSIEPEENEAVVGAALGAAARLVAEHLTLPDPPDHDGGFWARLERG